MKCFVFLNDHYYESNPAGIRYFFAYLLTSDDSEPVMNESLFATHQRIVIFRKTEKQIRSPKKVKSLTAKPTIMKNEIFWLYINLRKSYGTALTLNTARSVVVAL